MMRARVRLTFLALVMALLYYSMFPNLELSSDEKIVYDRVRDIQKNIWNTLEREIDLSPGADSMKTGLIGVEWSDITTTLGPLEAKRTATNPLWAAWLLRLFESRLQKGDEVVINASGSFPGMLLSALVAAEHYGLKVSFYASMTSSTWGANRIEAPLPVFLKIFRENGVRSISSGITIGGNNERGGGLDEDAVAILRASAARNGFEVADSVPLDEIRSKNPKLIILIGGSRSSSKIEKEFEDKKILRLLNLRKLCQESGIPYGGAFFEKKFSHPAPDKKTAAISAAGIFIFLIALKTHKRWEWGS